MKMSEAQKIIDSVESGFMVSLEWAEDGMLKSDHFPDKHAGEDLIETEIKAWSLARKFAGKTKGRAVHIYVIKSDFTPVSDYKDRLIENR